MLQSCRCQWEVKPCTVPEAGGQTLTHPLLVLMRQGSGLSTALKEKKKTHPDLGQPICIFLPPNTAQGEGAHPQKMPEGGLGGEQHTPALQEPGRLQAPWLLESPAHDCSLVICISLNAENPSEALVILQKLESFKPCGEPTLNGLQ